MPTFLMCSLMGGFFFLYRPVSWAQNNDCLADNEGVVWCALQEGGLGQRPNGEVSCCVGKCIKMTNGAVMCSSQANKPFASSPSHELTEGADARSF
jgi:hypothetical protein